MDGSGTTELDSILEDELVVLPRPSNIKGHQNKRAFQKRRRSRACDACRLRKTKCDAPPEGICSSCASASLLCKFTEAEDEKTKMGPARRLRLLEATVNELNEKLKATEAQLKESKAKNVNGGQTPQVENQAYAISPTSSSYRRDSTCSTYNGDSSPTSYNTDSQLSDRKSPRKSISQGMPQPKFPFDNTRIADLFVGSTSRLGFLASVQEYVEKLGYDTTSVLPAWRTSEAHTYVLSPPTISDPPSSINDLRVFLPPKQVGEKLLEIFFHSSIRGLPIFYQPTILRKFERAYEAPIFVGDHTAVTGIFCVLMMINAYSTLCSDNNEIVENLLPNQRRGWHFFEYAKRYHNLDKPIYSLADVEVLLIMSLYLDLAALPSPSWMVVGSLARVCQDLGLHRRPIEGKYSEVEKEHRSRMFWYSFLQDRKLALQTGRPLIFDEEEIDMPEPGTYDQSDLIDQALTESTVTMGSLASLQLVALLIASARFIDPILRMHVSNGLEQQIELQMLDMEYKQNNIEKQFPEGIFDWHNNDPLDPVLLKVAIIPMATRLSMYRFFTDETLSRSLRSRCFIRSVEVAKSTVHLLGRMMRYPDWQKGFRLYQTELSYHHIFKVAVILLLAHNLFTKQFQIATTSELNTSLHCLRVAASTRSTVLQSLQLFEVISSILNQDIPSGHPNASLAMSTCTPIPNSYSSGDYSTMNGMTSDNMPMNPTTSHPTPHSLLTATSIASSDLNNMSVNNINSLMHLNDLASDGNIATKFWPNYDGSGRAIAGFSNILTPSPNENTAWLSRVDPSYWSLMENVLSHEANIIERK